MFCPRLLREQSLGVVSRGPAQAQIFDPAAGGPWSEGVWPTDQTEGHESGDPGIHLVLVCSSAFPNGIPLPFKAFTLQLTCLYNSVVFSVLTELFSCHHDQV